MEDSKMSMSERQMQQYVISLVRLVVEDYGLPERPTWQEVISALGFPNVMFINMPNDKDGMRNGRQIYINSRITCRERIEFTIFHEIMHILIEEDGEIESELHDFFYRDKDDNQKHRVLEALCQIGAAEFAMPTAQFLPLMQDNNWKLSTVSTVAELFRCSVVASAFHFAHNYPRACTMLICEYGVPPRRNQSGLSSNSGDHLYIAYSVKNIHSHYPMCRDIRVPRDHFIHQVWLDAESAVGEATPFFKDQSSWKIPCEVVSIRGRAYAAYMPKDKMAFQSHPDQQVLF